MQGLKRRVRSLERELGTVLEPACPNCGHTASGKPKTFTLVRDDEDAGPEFCAVCGRKLVYTLEFDDRG